MQDGFCSTPARFSTDGLTALDRTTAIEDALGRVHARLRIEALNEEPVWARLDWQRWDSTCLLFGQTSAIRASRTPELIKDGDCAFRLLFSFNEGYRIVTNGIDENIPAGSATLLFNGAPSEIWLPQRSSLVALRLEDPALTAVAPSLAGTVMRRLSSDLPVMKLLIRYVDLLRRMEPADDPSLGLQISAHLTNLTILALAAPGVCADRTGTAVLAIIKAHIQTELRKPDLGAATIAPRYGMSVRQMQRLFERDGTTFSSFLLNCRLNRAYEMLINREFAAWPIRGIAASCGFTDAPYFSRAFRHAFRSTPTQVREKAFQAD